MAGEKMAEQEIVVEPTHVVSRQSTDILAIKDEEVAKAIGFIRQNVKRPMQVTDVVATTTLSRRTLQKRFRNELRRSILHEIRRVRVQEIIRLLMETHMTDIANCERNGLSQLRAYFTLFSQSHGNELAYISQKVRTNVIGN